MMHRNAAASNTQQPGAGTGGTLGGKPTRGVGRRPSVPSLNFDDSMYLWILTLIEVFLIGVLRKHFKRHHGG